MKTRSHLIPAFAAALLCTTAWFAVWLTAFQPLPARHEMRPDQPKVALLPAGPEPDPLSRPTLFALPAEQGFSGTFPEPRMHLALKLDHPQQPDYYLPRETAASPAPKEIQFTEPASLPQAGQLSAPDTVPFAAAASQPGIFLHLSPGLRLRTDSPFLLDGIGPLPDFLKAHLKVETDGRVSQCFFDTPVDNSALNGALRSLHFHPVPEATDGWLEIRVNPAGDR